MNRPDHYRENEKFRQLGKEELEDRKNPIMSINITRVSPFVDAYVDDYKDGLAKTKSTLPIYQSFLAKEILQ